MCCGIGGGGGGIGVGTDFSPSKFRPVACVAGIRAICWYPVCVCTHPVPGQRVSAHCHKPLTETAAQMDCAVRYSISGDTVTYTVGGDNVVFRGPTGQKRGVSIEYSDGTKQFYDGPRGAESVVKIEYPDGETVFYEGPRGEERVLRVEHRNCREGEDTYSYSSASPNRSPPSHRSHHQRNALSTSKPYCAAPAPSDQQSNPASRGFLPRSPGSMSAQGTTLQPRSVVWTKPPSHDRISTYQPGLLASRLNPRVSPRTAALAEGTRRNNN